MENRSSKARDLTRTGCRAEFRINLNRETGIYEKPLVILLGSNNYDKTCVFGVALLEKENWETYNWVLETFLECMDGKMPLTVLTDNCKSMDKALSNVMPDVVHRICSWHILKNAMHHIHKTGFNTDLRKFIFRYDLN
ncbi:hypothetical protein G4B88_010509 [Cannabis sativa]|uniref:MULE transposase domain-containing protein n=1 Tax=Cannabis sativa TaxID=3483 RepID=A0A7J6I681_CANSA|nr:hypothetical protein G4B88_010509 [Cannabis sativa]